MANESNPDLPISDAIFFLNDHIIQIHTVCEWANALGYSRPYFHELIKKEFGATPYEIIKEEKLKKIKKLLQENPQRKGFAIAREAGFSNMQALCHFLGWNFDTCLTRLRSQFTLSELAE